MTDPIMNLKPYRLRTVSMHSNGFFVSIVLMPFALVLLFMSNKGPWSWGIIAAGLLSFLYCMHQLVETFYLLPDGLLRRRFYGWETLAWTEIEAIGIQKIYTRGAKGIIILAYGKQRLFRIRLKPTHAEQCQAQLQHYCPHAVWIDENQGCFDIPSQGNLAQIQSLVRRHAQRLRRQHMIAILVCSLVFIPCIFITIQDLFAGHLTMENAKSAGFSLVLFLLLGGWNSLGALWRLRK